ncbi:MAG: DNA repair protein RecO [Planctomycetota bacterium]|nr:DNA repair protein RecO [Planctomycetota bacterium]
MALASDRCICVRKFEYSETSQILTLLSREHGLLRVIAKGAHRVTKAGAGRFDGGIDLLDAGNALFTDDTHRELGTLTEWKLADGHLKLRSRLRSLYLGLYAVELVSLLIEEHDPHPRIFDQLETLLNDLASPGQEELFLVFELDLLREAGFSPQLDMCVSCGQSSGDRDPVYFSSARGGVICRNCQTVVPDRMSIDPRLVRLLQSLQLPASNLSRRLPRLTRHQTDPLNQLLSRHLEDRLSRHLRMPRYILECRSTSERLPARVGHSG